ncbi:protein-glutamate methylesterase/protein-glutamine glutaminase [Desulfothermus okinawensis]
MLEKDPMIEVVGTARNGEEALEKIKTLDPDVVTLDIEMPKMDGLTALRHIMMEFPRPVIMVSSLTQEGAEATFKALELGAVDYIPKQLSKVSLEIVKIEKELQDKVKSVAKKKGKLKVRRRKIVEKAVETSQFKGKMQKRDLVGIGVSTGGPMAVQQVLTKLPAEFPAPILIAQHMPEAFTGPFAKRLDEMCKISVKEAENGEVVKSGVAYIARGGHHLRMVQKVSRIELEVSTEPKDALYKPSVNELMYSIALGVGKRGLGVILTGMGNDGLKGIEALKDRGGRALAQSEKTCVVYGMPRAIVEANLADEVVDISDMAEAIIRNLYV